MNNKSLHCLIMRVSNAIDYFHFAQIFFESLISKLYQVFTSFIFFEWMDLIFSKTTWIVPNTLISCSLSFKSDNSCWCCRSLELTKSSCSDLNSCTRGSKNNYIHTFCITSYQWHVYLKPSLFDFIITMSPFTLWINQQIITHSLRSKLLWWRHIWMSLKQQIRWSVWFSYQTQKWNIAL